MPQSLAQIQRKKQPSRRPEATHGKRFWRQKLDHLHDNPRRKGLVRLPQEWRWSSAAWYFSDGRQIVDVPEAKENFKSEDLEGYFAKARLPAPGSNYGRDYRKAITERWIHDDDANSYLTQTGRKAVDAGFGGKAKPRGKPVAKGAKKKGNVE